MIDFDDQYDFQAEAVENDWRRARRKVLYQQVVCAVTKCSVDMMSFADVRNRLQLGAPHALGLHEIRLDRIRGSVGRFHDFTSAFLPRKDMLHDRWTKVEQLLLQGKAPPIDVYKVGEAYFVVDGNHRVSAARQLGQETIEAFVTEFDTPFEIGPEHDVDKLLIEAEQTEFMKRVSQTNAQVAGKIVFSCAGCYRDLDGQIEAYRQGLETRDGKPVGIDEAFSAWYEEVYAAAVKAIRREGLLDLFPERTEADLFMWSWRHSDALEAGAADDDNRSDSATPMDAD